jgi:prolyl-tRNA editing enzyme YbaK/EbsC (Cys-tRNA(Pro) deacylase)
MQTAKRLFWFMAIEKVREYLKQWNRDGDIIELDASTATVADAAAALGVEPARIAKSISLKMPEQRGEVSPLAPNAVLRSPPLRGSMDSLSAPQRPGVFVIVSAGDVKLDNRKFKDRFGFKAKMLSPEEALEYTGHAVGGVCPFGLPPEVSVYLDISMRRFKTVFPACGSGNSAIELTLDELNEYAQNKEWVDVCKSTEE